MESTENNPDNSNKLLLSDLCSSCRDVISSILSIGEPSYLGEMFEESFDYNTLLNSPFEDDQFLREIDGIKTEVTSIQSPEVTSTAGKEVLERIHPLVEVKDVKASTVQETSRLNDVKTENLEISAAKLPAPLNMCNGIERCKPNCNMEDLRDKIKAPPNWKSSQLDNNNTNPATSNIFVNKNTSNISNTVQMEMSNEESDRIIQEFRKECYEILNPPEMNTLPSIEQYKLSQFENQCKFLSKGIGYDPPNIRTVKRTDPSVGALVLSTFTNAEKRSILDRRKKILLTLNRLLNLTSYINNPAKLGRISGANTFNNVPKHQH